MGPIDYTVDIQSPMQVGLQGFAAGDAIRGQMEARAQAEQARLAKEAMARDLDALYDDPTPQAIARVSLKYPQFSEQFKRSSDMLTQAQRDGLIVQGVPIDAALKAGQPQIAIQKLNELADGMEKSGDGQYVNAVRAVAKTIELDPKTASAQFGGLLASLMGAEKYAETLGKFGAESRAQEQAPAVARKLEADATAAEAGAVTAGVTAKFAESRAVQDLRMSEGQIKKWAADTEISKQNARIAAMNASIARETNQLKREELRMKMEDAVRERDDKLRGKVAEVESARFNIDNMINTADRVLSNPSLANVLGSIEGRLPSVLSDEGADAIALIDTLGSQAFLSQIPNVKGMGQLSNAEGEKLQSALQNLSRTQSEPQFRSNLKEAQRLMLKARKNVASRYGLPESTPDTPAAQPTSAQADEILRELGVIR